ncbi:MAG: S-adenosylmethionine decarboxylase [Candidatus Omnitrophica bacterium]|jgi:S-adenosylmethionine/arginine decarboxylase-like enzyme|nr:S-adenosylmethionine decarboxylase [Candidatus Omnitrophota bacterium]
MSRVPKFEEGSFGLEVVMDLYECNPKVIRSGKLLAEYVTKLCKLLKMKKFGKTQLPHFGYNEAHTSGFSMLQFIETSSITGHFSELWNSAYLNVFSCRDFDTKKCIDFTIKFFGAKRVNKRVLFRK